MYDRQQACEQGYTGGYAESTAMDVERERQMQAQLGGKLAAGRALSPVAQRGEIAMALDAQEKATCELAEVTKQLVGRLSPVLVSRPESDNAREGEPAFSSAVASAAQENTRRIRQTTLVLATLIRDLAL